MPTVLVVDDSAVDRRVAGGLIEQAGDFDVSYAEHGEDAIERMQHSVPDLVVTDLQMPELDGLGLVTRVRMLYPHVPVILMTAKGSESVAIEALDQGAAGYVPKSQLRDKLKHTVTDVLARASADQTYERLLGCQKRIDFTYELDNDPQLVDAFVDLVQQIVAGMQLCDHTGKFRLGVALREALLNALYRGNLEISFEQMQQSREALMRGDSPDIAQQRREQSPYAQRKIHVKADIQPQQARFTIRDDGSGFDHQKLAGHENLATHGAFDSQQGRGLVLIRSFMDEVEFNEAGNEITMIKNREAEMTRDEAND